MKKYKCIDAGPYCTLTYGKTYDCLHDTCRDEIEIKNDRGRRQYYKRRYFVEVREKVEKTPSPSTLNTAMIEKRVKAAREELQKLEADLKKAKEKPVSKNFVELIASTDGKRSKLNNALSTLSKELFGDTYGRLATRSDGNMFRKAIYIPSNIKASVQKDSLGYEVLVFEKR